MSEDSTYDYDVVVIGCGMAGLASALAAREGGASVAVLEKAPKKRRGGHTQFTESFRIPTSDIELDGVEFDVPDYTPSDFYSDIMKLSHYESDELMARTVTQNAAEMFEWISNYGFEWETQPPHAGYASGRVWLDGEQFVSEFVDVLEDEGVDIYYNAPARHLTQDDTGRVSGVEVKLDDRIVTFEAGSVVLACGGYESDKEKRTIYYGPGYESMKVRGSRYTTGEAIDAARDIGAKAEGQWSGAHMALIDAASPDVEGGITRVDGYQFGVIVNHNGERFFDEGEDTRDHTYAKLGRIIFEQPYHEAFIIVDSSRNDLVAHMGESRPITADSIDRLAERAGIENVEKTVETLESFNAACDPGEFEPNDLDYNSTTGIEPPKSNWAFPIDEPPYTAYPVTGGITFGFGGVGITEEAEVLDTTDNPIPGLYGAGNSTGGLFYNNYPGGTGLTNAAVFGMIAGRNAADFVQG